MCRHEVSGDAGGLIRWPVKLLIPVGFFLLALQGVSEIVKRIAFLDRPRSRIRRRGRRHRDAAARAVRPN